MTVLEIITGLAVFAVVIMTGWLLVRLGGVPAGSDTILTRVCFYAATPALLVTTIAHADLAAMISRDTAAGLGAEILGILGAGAIHRWFLKRSIAEVTIGALAGGYVNAANLGIPVLIVLLGDASAIAPILLLQLLIVSPVAFAVLDWTTARNAGSGSGWRGAWRAPLRNPLLIGVAIGLILNLLGWSAESWLGGLVGNSLHSLGALAVTVMMLSLGMSVAAASPKISQRLTITQISRLTGRGVTTAEKEVRDAGEAMAHARSVPLPLAEPVISAMSSTNNVAEGVNSADVSERGTVLWVTVAWKLLVVPLMAWALGYTLGMRGEDLLVPVTTASLPCAQNVFMYATRYEVAKSLARDCCLMTTAGFVPVVLAAAALLH